KKPCEATESELQFASVLARAAAVGHVTIASFGAMTVGFSVHVGHSGYPGLRKIPRHLSCVYGRRPQRPQTIGVFAPRKFSASPRTSSARTPMRSCGGSLTITSALRKRWKRSENASNNSSDVRFFA